MGIIAKRDTYEKDGWQKHPSGADVRVENGVVMEVDICTAKKEYFQEVVGEDESEYIQIRLNRIECKLDALVEKINQIYDTSKNVSGNY